MNIWIVIPAYNEQSSIKEVIKDIKIITKNILIVDDASTDLTKKFAQQMTARIISNKKNSGYSRSLEKGLRYAFSLGADYAISFDADGQHQASDLTRIMSIIKSEKPDFVIGNRNLKNRFMEVVVGFYTHLKYGFSDPFCGLKAFKKETFQKFGFLERKMTIGTELIFMALNKGATIKEINIVSPKRQGQARFGNSLKGNFLELKAFFNILTS